MRHLDLFSGIGGFALAAEWAWPDEKVEHVFCDNEPFAQAILRKHWPNSPVFSDIKHFNAELRNAMMSVCEEKTDSALCAEYQRRLSVAPIANHAIPRESLSGVMETETNIGSTNENGSGRAKQESSNTTEGDANAAASQSRSSSQSTTNSITETKSDGITNRKHGNSRLKEVCQTTTNCSATTATTLKLITEHVLTKPIDLLTGGFPCQPFSAAGRRKGTEDDRHLWPSMLETIRLLRPTYILGENVGGFITWNGGLVFEEVCTDLEKEGYEVCPLVIPACALDAPHRRDRVWIAAQNSKRERRAHGESEEEGAEIRELGESRAGDGDGLRREKDASDAKHIRPPDTEPKSSKGLTEQCGNSREDEKRNAYWDEDWPQVAARLCTLDDGLPNGLARPRGWRNAALKGAGNAIVPQVAAEILKAMRHGENPNQA